MSGHYLASCHGKQQFSSYDAAKAGAEHLGSNASPYKCRYGDHYHRGRKSWK